MSAWDSIVLNDDINEEFLDDLADMDDDEIVENMRDACLLARDGGTDDENRNGLAAATIAAIWAGAPFSAGEVVEKYSFIHGLADSGDEELNETAVALLESVANGNDDTYDGEDFSSEDLSEFIEALS